MRNPNLTQLTANACCLIAAVAAGTALTQEQQQRGLKFNNLTVLPFMNVEYTYDSNVYYDQRSSMEEDDSILRVNPGVDIGYEGNMWGLSGNAWYAYDWYHDNSDLDADRYGEKLSVYKETASGWKLILGENYMKTGQNDSLADGGRGLWRDRELMDLTGILSKKLGELTEVTLNTIYSDLKYANDNSQYSPLYGWTEWSTGLEVARKLTEKSNVLLNGSYQKFESDGAKDGTSADSTGYTLQAGFSSRATQRIKYRALTGVSWFEYADSEKEAGWTYSLDANWLINKKLAASVAGSSFFQPSEQYMNQAVQAYVMSAGLTYKPYRKLTTRLDVAYRREENQYTTADSSDWTEDRYTLRARADYELMRYVTVYGCMEYEDLTADDEENEYDRYRATVGLSFRY